MADVRAEFFSLYGSLFFLGILLSVLFLFATLLMLYYKQVVEGYEDASRFAIMQRVGMTKRDIRESVNAQMLLIFLLPLAAAALLFLRRLLLGSMTFFGVIPFLPPVILAVMASFELPRSAVIAGIVFGALCDLVLPAPFACLYTIAFTLAALLISTVVSNLLQQGFARALLSTVLAFLLVDLLQAFALLPRSGSAAILPMLHLFARETALSCLLLVPVYPALRAVRRAFPD